MIRLTLRLEYGADIGLHSNGISSTNHRFSSTLTEAMRVTRARSDGKVGAWRRSRG